MKRFQDVFSSDADDSSESTTKKSKVEKETHDFRLVSRGFGDLKTRYRPWKLEELAPTCELKQLKKLIKDPEKSSRVHLLEGLTGCGKTTCARILAKAWVCSAEDPDVKPCLQCNHCQAFENEKEPCPDITEINVADHRKIDDMRRLVNEMQFKPQFIGKLIFILDEVQQLTPEAQQLLLKVFEEPHDHLLIFLCTTDKRGLDKALVDRANPITFKPITPYHAAQITEQILRLEGATNVSDEVKESFYLNCQGSVRALMNNIQLYLDGGEGTALSNNEELDDDNVQPLAAALLKLDWDRVRSILNTNVYIKRNAESVRIQLENYFRGALLKADAASMRGPAKALRYMTGSLHNEIQISQFNQLVFKCACICEPKS